MKAKKILSAVLAGVIAAGVVIPCYADTAKDKLTEAQKQQQQAESSLSGTKERISRLEAKKGQSESYLTELNSQLEELKDSLAQLQTDYDAKQVELETVRQELEEAQQRETKQYEDMKLRIQYMYERSEDNYLEMLFSSKSITDFLSKTNNISMMSEYDRNMLDNYRSVREEVAQKKEKVIEEQNAIKELQEQSLERQEEVSVLVEATYNEIRSYQADIQEAESQEAGLLKQISKNEDEINRLLKQAKDEEAKREEEEKKKQEAAQKPESKPENKPETKPEEKPSAGGEAEDPPNTDEGTGNDADADKNGGTGNSSENGGGTNSGEDADSQEPEEQKKYLGRFKVTAYCPCSTCCGPGSSGITASGVKPTQGRTVAMSGVPFGTKLLINGHVYTVEDRGTSYGHVDIFFANHSDALRFGRKYAEVYQVN